MPEKVGLKAVMRDGVDYEFTLVLDIDIKHNATASKDRTGLFVDQPAFVISDETGRTITRWCCIDDDVDQVIEQIRKTNTHDELMKVYTSNIHLRSLISKELILKKRELAASSNVPEHSLQIQQL